MTKVFKLFVFFGHFQASFLNMYFQGFYNCLIHMDSVTCLLGYVFPGVTTKRGKSC